MLWQKTERKEFFFFFFFCFSISHLAIKSVQESQLILHSHQFKSNLAKNPSGTATLYICILMQASGWGKPPITPEYLGLRSSFVFICFFFQLGNFHCGSVRKLCLSFLWLLLLRFLLCLQVQIDMVFLVIKKSMTDDQRNVPIPLLCSAFVINKGSFFLRLHGKFVIYEERSWQKIGIFLQLQCLLSFLQ